MFRDVGVIFSFFLELFFFVSSCWSLMRYVDRP